MARLTASGSSTVEECPARGMRTSFDPAMAAQITIRAYADQIGRN